MLLTAGALVSAGLLSCGKKAPPIPPERPPLAQVTQLNGALEGDTVKLTWRHTGTRSTKAYVVLRAQSDAAKPDCPRCPIIFQQVGIRTVDADTETVEFTEPVPTGFIYTYKVQPVGSSGDRGPDSNVVIIDRSVH